MPKKLYAKAIIASFVITGFCPLLALAGGTDEKVLIESLEISSPTKAQINLKPTNSKYFSLRPSCSAMIIHIDYNPLEPGFARSWSQYINQSQHKEAIAYLRQAYEQQQPIYFGEVGVGFKPKTASWWEQVAEQINFLLLRLQGINPVKIQRPDRTGGCIFETQALQLAERFDGAKGIISYRDPI